MENLGSSAPKIKSVAGWIFGVLAFVFLLGGVRFGWGFGSWLFSLGAFFAIITTIIGAVKKSTGQIFLGIAGILFAVLLVLYLYVPQINQTSLPTTAQPPVSQQTPPVTTKNPPVTTLGTPSLSADKKTVVADGKILLAIDNDTIFNWFKTESQLCDGYNLTTTPDRKTFCENKTFFKSQTRFTSVVVSPDKMKIGFTIESDTLTPDKVVGIFSRSTNAVNLLGGYYLGNEFIGFSPNGTNFIYQGGCFEGMCGLYVKNSETLADKASLSDSDESADARTRTATFVKWASDNEIEYKLGTELKRASF